MAKREFNVYVVRLRNSVIKDDDFRSENRNYTPGKNCYYVGSTGLDPEERFKRHKSGIFANEYAKPYGEYLTPRHYERLNPIATREEAERIERQLADRLRSRGHAVWQR